MKILNFVIILFTLYSCESKSQEKITKLAIEDRKLLDEVLNDQNFELQTIKKTDSSQNIKIILYYDIAFSLERKVINKFNRNNQLENIQEYHSNTDDKEFLKLFSEKKYSYSKNSEKISTKVWREGKETGNEVIEKSFDEKTKLLQLKSKTTSLDSKKTITVNETYKYTFNKSQNTATVCVEEYNELNKPKSFETCNTYLFINGKISDSNVGNKYEYDQKNRLIRDVKFDQNNNPYFEDLYMYDDKKKMMEHQRYRFNHSKFLAVKDQTFYNDKGLIHKRINFKMNEDDNLVPEKQFIKFYNKNNKEILEIELKSKTFVDKSTIPF